MNPGGVPHSFFLEALRHHHRPRNDLASSPEYERDPIAGHRRGRVSDSRFGLHLGRS